MFPIAGPALELETVAGTYQVSVLGVVNSVMFARPEAVGLTGEETPETVDRDSELLVRIERLRAAACEVLGYVDDASEAGDVSPGVPKMAFVTDHPHDLRL